MGTSIGCSRGTRWSRSRSHHRRGVNTFESALGIHVLGQQPNLPDDALQSEPELIPVGVALHGDRAAASFTGRLEQMFEDDQLRRDFRRAFRDGEVVGIQRGAGRRRDRSVFWSALSCETSNRRLDCSSPFRRPSSTFASPAVRGFVMRSGRGLPFRTLANSTPYRLLCDRFERTLPQSDQAMTGFFVRFVSAMQSSRPRHHARTAAARCRRRRAP